MELSGFQTHTYLISFNVEAFKKAFKYLLDDSLFKFVTRIYQQIINIPVGSDPVPFILANLKKRKQKRPCIGLKFLERFLFY